MDFRPRSESEDLPLGIGEYDAVVTAAEERKSKAGDLMWKLDLDVYDESGKPEPLTDYVMVEGPAGWRFRRFCEMAGLKAKYESGHVETDDLVGLPVRVLTAIEPSQGDFPAKVRVSKYIKAKADAPRPQPQPVAAGAGNSDEDDDLPF